jgi:DNA repair protein RecO (recombination protein O)
MIARNKSKKTIVPKSLFMPLSCLELEVNHRENRELQRIKEARLCFPLPDIQTDPIKNALSLFIAETLFRTLRTTGADSKLFDFIYRSILLLEETNRGIANFHITFLLQLVKYLGFAPYMETYSQGSFFDMQNGRFVDSPPLNGDYLTATESRIFADLFRINYENMSIHTFSRKERAEILEHILKYYRLHIPEIREFKSMAVLQTLFD